MLNDKTYTILKWIAIIAIPACEGLWITLASIWKLPYAMEIGGTLAAIGTAIGALLGISAVKYNKAKKAAIEGDETTE